MKKALAAFAAALILVAQTITEEPPARRASRGTRAAIGVGSDAAMEAAQRMLHRGGNAVDAGVAAVFAAAVVEFSHVGLGGETPILIRTADARVISLAGVGTMPRLASAQLFRTRPLQPTEVMQLEPGGMQPMVPVAGLMPALVPGTVDAALVALREYGTLRFAEVIEPSIELADGHAMDELRAAYIRRGRDFYVVWPEAAAVFLPRGEVPRPGQVFRQPDLARTLRAMAAAEGRAGESRVRGIDAVRDYFYRGPIARSIDEFSRSRGGLLRYEDLAAFRVEPEPAVSLPWREYVVHKPGFWSQGPAMLEALGALGGTELGRMGRNSSSYLHAVTEALKLAYADRDTWYGDPAVTNLPYPDLLSEAYSRERGALIGASASFDFRPGVLAGRSGVHPVQSRRGESRITDETASKDTTGIVVADAQGNWFAATPSGAWLPAVIAGDTGIPLSQRAQSFLLIPGHPNELAPGKRPRITLSPTIVTRGGEPVLAMSTPGGDVQEQAQLQLLFNVLLFGMNAQAAVEAPRLQSRHLVSSFDNHAMNPGELIVDERIPAAVLDGLAKRGHKILSRSKWASGSAPVLIRRLPGGVLEIGIDAYGYRTGSAW